MSIGGTEGGASTLRVFISYRREDAADAAGRLYDSLTDHFRDQVFMDIDTIEPGVDFIDVVNQAVGSCDVLLALIGRQWTTAVDAKGRRRLEDEDDFVRLEIKAALDRKVRVIPVLLQGASMPGSDELPQALSGLARRNALEISHARWHYDVGRLVEVLDRLDEMKQANQEQATLNRAAPEQAEQEEAGQRSRREAADQEAREKAELEARKRAQQEAPKQTQREAPEPAGPPLWTAAIVLGATFLLGGIVLPISTIYGSSVRITTLTAWNLTDSVGALIGVMATFVLWWRRRLGLSVTRGALIGFGAYGLLLYATYALISSIEFKNLKTSSGPPTPSAGAFVGLVGAGLVLWAGLQTDGGRDIPAPRSMGTETTGPLDQILLITGAVLLAVAALLLPAIGFSAGEGLKLFTLAPPLLLVPIGTAALVLGSATTVLPRDRLTAAAIAAAAGVEIFLSNLGIAGYALTSKDSLVPGAGAILSLVAAGLIVAGGVIAYRSSAKS